MDEKTAKQIVAMAIKKEKIRNQLRELAFDKQLAIIDDPSRLKSLLCSRRSGKSYGCGLGLVEAALGTPYVQCLYVGLVRETAKNILWNPILKKIVRDLGIPMPKNAWNETSLTVTFKNHSTIRLVGMDRDSASLDKVLGAGLRRVVIDEAASFRIDMETFVYSHLQPATADYLGDIWLAGTPGPVRNFYFKVTTGKEPGWKQFGWKTSDNPHMAAQWEETLAQIRRDRPSYIDTPEYRMMYEGEWHTDREGLCYHYDETVNDVEEDDLPEFSDGIISCDLGYNDDTAFAVSGWNEFDPNLYFVHTEKRPGMLITDVANRFKALQAEYPFVTKLVVDGANKQAVEEMKHRHGLPLVATEKKGKSDFIAQMDTDLRVGKVRVLRGKCEPLTLEWLGLVWDKRAEERTRRKVEHPSCPNHLCDAALYGWRYARNFHNSTRPGKEITRDDPDWGREWFRKKREQMARDAQEAENEAKDYWGID